MGHLNPNIENFLSYTRNRDYIDKSGMIEETNALLGTDGRFICMVRPRRFGKSLMANILNAYYGKKNDTRELFSKYEASKCDSFETHLNKYDVIYIDFNSVYPFIKEQKSMGVEINILAYLHKKIVAELIEEFGDAAKTEYLSLSASIRKINKELGLKFVFIIDEWDCIFREEKNNLQLQEDYINFLRGLFKGDEAEKCVALAYITGIFPIIKYGKQSALNSFFEYTMIESSPFSKYIGFTKEEVDRLCETYDLNRTEMTNWYDGYTLDGIHIYNPRSVVTSVFKKKFGSYWTRTDSFEVLTDYFRMMPDVKEDIVNMIGGESVRVNTDLFNNDITKVNGKDELYTVLVHLGYLSYDSSDATVRIPNEEIRKEFINAIQDTGWDEIVSLFKNSEKLLDYVWKKKSDKVAEIIRAMHSTETSCLRYNDENSLYTIIAIAFYSARAHYTFHYELQGGDGYADIVFLPRLGVTRPPMVVELKFDKTAKLAIDQIRNKRYPECMKKFGLERLKTCLLVGINYDEKTKDHECVVEEVEISEI